MRASEVPILYLGETTFRRKYRRFGMRRADRLSHLYVIGKTGVGKSTFLEQLARQDLDAGHGFAVIDPHGDLVERLAASVGAPDHRRVRYLNAADPHQPYGYNPVRRVRDDKIPLAASGLMDTLKKLWPDAWGVRMEHVLRNSLYVLLEDLTVREPVDRQRLAGKESAPDATLSRRIRRVIVSSTYRRI